MGVEMPHTQMEPGTGQPGKLLNYHGSTSPDGDEQPKAIRADLNRSGGVSADYVNFTTRIEDVPFEYVDDDSGERVFTNRTLTLYDYPLGTTVTAVAQRLSSAGGRTNVYATVIFPLATIEGMLLSVPRFNGGTLYIQELTGLAGTWRYIGNRDLISVPVGYANLFPATPAELNVDSHGVFVRIS